MPQTFFDLVAPVALVIAQKTNMLPETLLCQFADETGYFAGGCWRGKAGWKGKFNLAGISPNGEIADYPSYSEFAAEYIRVISVRAYGYPEVLAQRDVSSQCYALGRSSWAGSKYDANKTGKPGCDLVGIYQRYRSEIDSALAGARTGLLTGNGQVKVAEYLNTALGGLGKAWDADPAGRDFYHDIAKQVRKYAKERGLPGVTVGQ